jgi:hypothetical protein
MNDLPLPPSQLLHLLDQPKLNATEYQYAVHAIAIHVEEYRRTFVRALTALYPTTSVTKDLPQDG